MTSLHVGSHESFNLPFV